MAEVWGAHSAFQTAVQSPFVCIGGPDDGDAAPAAAVDVDADVFPVTAALGSGEFAVTEAGLSVPEACVALPLPLSDIVSVAAMLAGDGRVCCGCLE